MLRADWTPVVLIASTVSLTIVTIVLVTSPVFQPTYDTTPGPARPRHELPERVAVWVGDLDGGVRAVLAPVWGDPEPDRLHDRTLNEGLGIPMASALAFYELLLFNTSDETQRVALDDAALSIQPSEEGASPVPLRSVAKLVDRGVASPSPALAVVLKGRGTLLDAVELEAGAMASLLVAFQRRVDLDAAGQVGTADGKAFRRRPMARRELEDLVLDPTQREVENL